MKYTFKDSASIIFLWPFAALYAAIDYLRQGCYRFGIFKSTMVELPVICVGNITAGGTGKSPFCIMLAESLHLTGRKPAILSRGYKRIFGQAESLAVSDWHNILAQVEQSGDEPFLMAKKLLGRAIVIVGKNRTETAALAKKMGADVIIMDDGFQHRKLSRDLDIVLLDGKRPWGNGWLLPVGRLREPASAFKRAGIIIITRYDAGSGCQPVEKLMNKYRLNQPVLYCRHNPVGFKSIENIPTSNFLKLSAESKLLLFSGIARPDSFQDSVRSLGCEASQHIIFRDHHSYDLPDLERIAEAAKKCEAVITTEKDAVKLPKDWDPGKPLFALEIEIAFHPENGKEELLELVKEAIKR